MSPYKAATIAARRKWPQQAVSPSELRGVISDVTGFDHGNPFGSRDEVMEYFSPSAQAEMFGDDAVMDEEMLLAMASAVLEHKWHCSF